MAVSVSAVLAIAIVLAGLAGSCAPRSLVEVDVLGDAPFQGVTLNLSANHTTKVFANATFNATMAFKAGLYLPDSVNGTVTVVARVVDGTGNCIGAGQVPVAEVTSGKATSAVMLTVSHTSDCASALPDAGTGMGGNRSGGGSGGAGGNLPGSGGSGTAGANGGLGGNLGGNLGGMTGAGGAAGQTGGSNLITNGDFSNGETNWGLPGTPVGAVSHAVTGGAFCVTFSSPASSVTVGYPSGGASPFTITSGVSYLFSYQASVTGGPATVEAKVGQTTTPYDATGSDWMNEPVGATVQTFSHTFTRAATDSMMGVAFNLGGGPSAVCIDNVSVKAN